ncbi:N-acetylmuramoyl-L-alanine amidase [Clostridium sp. Marseille-Q7071]
MALINKGDTLTISAGHCTKTDLGAVGYKIEAELNKSITKEFVKLCNKYNLTIYDVTPYDEDLSVNDRLVLEVNRANNYKPKLHICMHHNSSDGNGYGTEVYVFSNSGLASSCAKAVVDAISNLGLRNRGVKENKSLYVPRETNMACILPEVAFVDNKNDMNLWQKLGPYTVAKSIFKALTGIDDNKETIPTTDDYSIKDKIAQITADILNVRSGPGINYSVIGQLKKNDKVKLYKKSNGWYSIYYGNSGGYINISYIKIL